MSMYLLNDENITKIKDYSEQRESTEQASKNLAVSLSAALRKYADEMLKKISKTLANIDEQHKEALKTHREVLQALEAELDAIDNTPFEERHQDNVLDSTIDLLHNLLTSQFIEAIAPKRQSRNLSFIGAPVEDLYRMTESALGKAEEALGRNKDIEEKEEFTDRKNKKSVSFGETEEEDPIEQINEDTLNEDEVVEAKDEDEDLIVIEVLKKTASTASFKRHDSKHLLTKSSLPSIKLEEIGDTPRPDADVFNRYGRVVLPQEQKPIAGKTGPAKMLDPEAAERPEGKTPADVFADDLKFGDDKPKKEVDLEPVKFGADGKAIALDIERGRPSFGGFPHGEPELHGVPIPFGDEDKTDEGKKTIEPATFRTDRHLERELSFERDTPEMLRDVGRTIDRFHSFDLPEDDTRDRTATALDRRLLKIRATEKVKEKTTDFSYNPVLEDKELVRDGVNKGVIFKITKLAEENTYVHGPGENYSQEVWDQNIEDKQRIQSTKVSAREVFADDGRACVLIDVENNLAPGSREDLAVVDGAKIIIKNSSAINTSQEVGDTAVSQATSVIANALVELANGIEQQDTNYDTRFVTVNRPRATEITDGAKAIKTAGSLVHTGIMVLSTKTIPVFTSEDLNLLREFAIDDLERFKTGDTKADARMMQNHANAVKLLDIIWNVRDPDKATPAQIAKVHEDFLEAFSSGEYKAKAKGPKRH